MQSITSHSIVVYTRVILERDKIDFSTVSVVSIVARLQKPKAYTCMYHRLHTHIHACT